MHRICTVDFLNCCIESWFCFLQALLPVVALFFCLDAKEPKDQGSGRGASRPIICFNLLFRAGRDHMAIGRQACSAGPPDPVVHRAMFFACSISMGRGTPFCPWPCLRCARRRGSLAGTDSCVAFRFFWMHARNQRYTPHIRRRTLSGVWPLLMLCICSVEFLNCCIARWLCFLQALLPVVACSFALMQKNQKIKAPGKAHPARSFAVVYCFVPGGTTWPLGARLVPLARLIL